MEIVNCMGQPLVDSYIIYLLDGVEEDNYNCPL